MLATGLLLQLQGCRHAAQPQWRLLCLAVIGIWKLLLCGVQRLLCMAALTTCQFVWAGLALGAGVVWLARLSPAGGVGLLTTWSPWRLCAGNQALQCAPLC